MKNAYDMAELIQRMYLSGVCSNALSDWLDISKDELRVILESHDKIKSNIPTVVKIVEKSSLSLAKEVHRCQYCRKPGKMYHIHSGYRTLCISCLADKLDYGDKRFARFTWTNMTIEEIYKAFEDCYVGGFTAYSAMGNWEECITADYIGTLEGALEWYSWQDQSCTIVPGRFPRRGANVIENSGLSVEKMVGIWHNRPVETEKLYDETMEVCHDGTGIYTDLKGRRLEMNWYIDGGILNIALDDKFTFYRGPFYYRESDVVKDIHGKNHTFPSWGWTEHDAARLAIRGKYYKVA